MKNKHCVLIPGHIHILFADIHVLGKIIEGSGLDTVAIESRIYSVSTLRGICEGKKYTRGMEDHIINALAILSLKLETVYGSDLPDDLGNQAKSFRDGLHEDKPGVLEIYEYHASNYAGNIKPNLPKYNEDLHEFLEILQALGGDSCTFFRHGAT